MKKTAILSIFIALLCTMTSVTTAEGLLPQLEDFYGVAMPSLFDTLKRSPDEQNMLQDESVQEIWYEVSDDDYSEFGDYLSRSGCDMVSYSVEGSIFNAEVAKEDKSFFFSYDNERKCAILVYPLGTYDGALDKAERMYQQGLELYSKGDVIGARYAFWQAGRSYKDSDKYIRDITEYKKDSIVLEGSLFCIMSDGTVGVAEEGNEYGADKVNKWNSIIALSSSYYHTVGVKRDGTVIATGKKGIVSCNVKNWRSIKKVCADGWIDDGKDYTFTVGLKEDGTVVATGNNDFGQCNVSDWSEIEDIITFRYLTIGLKKDGTVLCTDEEFYEDLKSWDHIISLSKGHDLVLGYYVIGLKENGTVVTTLYGVDVDSWKNITTVISGTNSNVVIGLTADGSVIASKNKNSHIWYSWKDIVAIAAGSRHTLGLRADGTVVAMGDTDDGQCRVSDWTDIVSIYAYYNTSYGVKSDGSFVAVGDNRFGSCNFEDWDLWDEWDIEDSIVSDSTDVPENEAGSIQFPALKKGAKGEAVIRIQIALIEKGYLSGKADGDYGQMTEDAVKQMQIKYGMETTGVADEEFQKKLYGN